MSSLGVGGGGRFLTASGRALSSSFGVSTAPLDTSGSLNSALSATLSTAFFASEAALLTS